MLRQGRFEAALAHAERGAVDASETYAEPEALRLLATAQAAAGHTAESAKTLARLETQVKQLPGRAELRRVHWARGRIALHRGDAAAAVRELRTAVAMLPRHGPPVGPPSSHADLWYDAAEALIEAGHDAEAGGLLERIQEGHERVFGPEAWARSFYRFGQIYERRGDAARAREQYRRFVELWGDGDLERGWVEDARRKLRR
jgi:tetratricopeptide (TPR) repeat protein